MSHKTVEESIIFRASQLAETFTFIVTEELRMWLHTPRPCRGAELVPQFSHRGGYSRFEELQPQPRDDGMS